MITRKHTTERASKIVIFNHTVYLSGQVPDDVSLEIQEQTQSTLARIDTLLAEANSDKDHILSATVYLKNMEHFHPMNAIWNSWINTGHAPARACVQANMARDAILVEISIVAAQKES